MKLLAGYTWICMLNWLLTRNTLGLMSWVTIHHGSVYLTIGEYRLLFRFMMYLSPFAEWTSIGWKCSSRFWGRSCFWPGIHPGIMDSSVLNMVYQEAFLCFLTVTIMFLQLEFIRDERRNYRSTSAIWNLELNMVHFFSSTDIIWKLIKVHLIWNAILPNLN